MDLAFQKAQEGLEAREVPIGCVMIYNESVIASAANCVNQTKNATRHAEMACVDQVLEWCEQHHERPEIIFPKIKVFVTMEPCIMCMAAMRILFMSDITFGCANDKFGGCGTVLSIHEDKIFVGEKEIKITRGVKAEEAVSMLKDFYRGENPNAPFPKLKSHSKRDTND